MLNHERLRETLFTLLGRTVSVSPGTRLDPSTPGFTALYVDEAGRPTGMAVFDLPLAAHSGAALVMVPPKSAKEAVASGSLPQTLRENFYEVMNVVSVVFADALRRRQKLQATFDNPKVPDAANRVLSAPHKRLDVTVAIDGYGEGRTSLYTW